jgi:hypothetical protein
MEALEGRSLRGVSLALGKRLALAKHVAPGKASDADYRGRIRRFRDGEIGLAPETIFALGEALRDCGIGWSTGFTALWFEGLFSDYARSLWNLAQSPCDWGNGWTAPNLAATVGIMAPLFTGVLERDDDLAEWLDGERRAFSVFLRNLPTDWSAEASHDDRVASERDDLLVSAAAFGDNKEISITSRENYIAMMVVEWAISTASAPLREGRVASIAGLWASRWERLIKREREVTVARAGAQRTSVKPTKSRRRIT